jgi:hypothetical protein
VLLDQPISRPNEMQDLTFSSKETTQLTGDFDNLKLEHERILRENHDLLQLVV